MVEIEQALDRGIDARQIGELKLRAEQQLQADPVDRLHLDLGTEAFEERVALDPGRDAGIDQRVAQGFDVTIDRLTLGGRRATSWNL